MNAGDSTPKSAEGGGISELARYNAIHNLTQAMVKVNELSDLLAITECSQYLSIKTRALRSLIAQDLLKFVDTNPT